MRERELFFDFMTEKHFERLAKGFLKVERRLDLKEAANARKKKEKEKRMSFDAISTSSDDAVAPCVDQWSLSSSMDKSCANFLR